MHSVYLIKSTTKNRTYVGYTTKMNKRIRQHNGEIKGGAKYTQVGRPWIIIVEISGFPTKSSALQYEWKNHHPPKNWTYNRNKGRLYHRLKIMKNILLLEKSTENAPLNNTLNLSYNFSNEEYKTMWNDAENF